MYVHIFKKYKSSFMVLSHHTMTNCHNTCTDVILM